MSNTRPDKLYTAKEAREILGGLSPTSFKRLVDGGKIRRIIPPNKKYGLYSKEDVDNMAAVMKEFIEIYSSDEVKGYKFELASNDEEIKETVQIAKQRLGERATSLETRLERFHKSPKSDYVLKHNGVIVGFFSMLSLKPEVTEELFKRKTGRWVTVEDIEPIVSGKPLEIVISNIASRYGGEKHLETEYGKRLILDVIQLFINAGKDGIDIRRVWAMSSTVGGIKLCRDIFKFEELGYVNNEQIGFVLDIETSKSPIAEQYRRARTKAKNNN